MNIISGRVVTVIFYLHRDMIGVQLEDGFLAKEGRIILNNSESKITGDGTLLAGITEIGRYFDTRQKVKATLYPDTEHYGACLKAEFTKEGI